MNIVSHLVRTGCSSLSSPHEHYNKIKIAPSKHYPEAARGLHATITFSIFSIPSHTAAPLILDGIHASPKPVRRTTHRYFVLTWKGDMERNSGTSRRAHMSAVLSSSGRTVAVGLGLTQAPAPIACVACWIGLATLAPS